MLLVSPHSYDDPFLRSTKPRSAHTACFEDYLMLLPSLLVIGISKVKNTEIWHRRQFRPRLAAGWPSLPWRLFKGQTILKRSYPPFDDYRVLSFTIIVVDRDFQD